MANSPRTLSKLTRRHWRIVAGLGFLLVCGSLAVWFGFPFKDLKEWQTLLSATLALGAASLVYRAAMAKVGFDREQAAREVKRRELSILMKVDFALGELLDVARRVDGNLMFKSVVPDVSTMTAEELRMAEPMEFEEAWQHLDIFPQACIHELRELRRSLRDLARHLKSIETSSPWTLPPNSVDIPQGRDDIARLAQGVWQGCVVLQSQLSKTIKAFAPETDDRMLLIYGDPSADEEWDGDRG